MSNFKIDSINGNGDIYYIEGIDFIFRIFGYNKESIANYIDFFEQELGIPTNTTGFGNIKLEITNYEQIEKLFSSMDLNTQFINNGTYKSTLFLELNTIDIIFDGLNKYIKSIGLKDEVEDMILNRIQVYLFEYWNPCAHIEAVTDLPKKESDKFTLMINGNWNSVGFEFFQKKLHNVYTCEYINADTCTNIQSNNVGGETILRTMLSSNFAIKRSPFAENVLYMTGNRLNDDIFNNSNSLLIQDLGKRGVKEDILINMVEIINKNR